MTDSTPPGRHLGDFELIRELGSGGMGTVWEAVQTSLGRRVALKILAPHISMSPTSLQRFQREAEAGARLTHPQTGGEEPRMCLLNSVDACETCSWGYRCRRPADW